MQTKLLFSKAGLIVLAIFCAVLIGAINLTWNGVRIDLTENKLYTLSQGSRNILKGLEEPVTLRFYFSARQTETVPALRNYARRIQELLEEYAQFGGGNIDLQTIDPEPFSEQEDAADAYGLQKVRLSAGGDQIILGLVGERKGGQAEAIAFFHPDREEFLEQDISKLIFSASRGRKPTIGVMSSLSVNGGMDFNTRQPTPAWVAVAQLRKLYRVLNISMPGDRISDEVDVLLLIQPGKLSDSALYAIDQYVMRGGDAMIFADPISDVVQQQFGNTKLPEENASITRLLQHWGVKLPRDKILGDARHALSVSRGANQVPTRYLAIQGYGRDNFPKDDVVTNKLESINVASVGVIEALAGSGIKFTPLIVSSSQSMLIERSRFEPLPDPAKLHQGFKPGGEKYTVAARVTGNFTTAFPDGYKPPEPDENTTGDANTEQPAQEEQEKAVDLPAHISATSEPVSLIVVADSDILSNRLWVRVQDFFGQQVTSPFADNGDFLLNALDNLLGSADLISIRGRDRYSRPFEVVDELRRDADARFQNKERELLARLQEAESKLAELQQEKQGDKEEETILSEEQIETVQRFQQEKLRVRKELREVRHRLGSDINNLGSWLKFINIALMPILLTFGMLLLFRVIVRRRKNCGVD